MHVIEPWQTSVTLFSKEGRVTVYKSIAEARRQLGVRWIGRNVGPPLKA